MPEGAGCCVIKLGGVGSTRKKLIRELLDSTGILGGFLKSNQGEFGHSSEGVVVEIQRTHRSAHPDGGEESYVA